MTSYPAISIYAGASLHVGWAVFHLFFPKLFKWKTALQELDAVNRNIHQIMNLCLVFYFLASAYICFRFAPELLGTTLGHKLLGVFAAFWLFRLSLQFKFFKGAHPVSLFMSLMFLITAGTYVFPLLQGAP